MSFYPPHLYTYFTYEFTYNLHYLYHSFSHENNSLSDLESNIVLKAYQPIILGSSADLDLMYNSEDAGLYYWSTSSSGIPANTPNNTTNDCHMQIFGGSGREIVQIVYRYASGIAAIYGRYYYIGDKKWVDWKTLF